MFYETNIGRLILEQIAAQEKTASVKTAYDQSEAMKVSEGLSKIASLPYKEGVYGSVQDIMKIASDCIAGLCQAIESEKQKASTLEKTAEIRVLLEDMVNYGIIDKANINEKVAELVVKTPQQIEIIKEAVKMSLSRDGSGFFEKNAGDTSNVRAEKRGIFDDVVGDN